MSVTWRAQAWVDGLANGASEVIGVTSDTDRLGKPAAGELRLVAPLVWGETVDDQLWPAQPREYARFSILANTAAELAGPDKGTACAFAFKTPASPAPGPGSANPFSVKFVGRVEGYRLRPHQLGVVAEVTAVDLVVAVLGQETTGDAAWASEAISTRIGRVLGTFGVDWFGPTPTPAFDPSVTARAASLASKLELAQRYTQEWVDMVGGGTGTAVGRPILTPDVTGNDPDVHDQFFADAWVLYRQNKAIDPDTHNLNTASGQSRVVPGLVVLDAGLVDFSSAWTMAADQNPTRLVTTYDNAGAQAAVELANADYPARDVVRKYESDLTTLANANRVNKVYLPPNGLSPWQADTFRYRLGRGPTDGPVVPRVGQVVTIDGIPADLNPEGVDSYTGQLMATELSIDYGEVTQDLTLRPALLNYPAGTTRYYMPSTAPTLSPAYGSLWDRTAAAARGTLTHFKPISGTTTTTASDTEAVATANYDVLLRQYVTAEFTGEAKVIPAGTAFRCVLRAQESATGADFVLQLAIRVVDAAGVEQATLYEGSSTTASATGGANNQEFPTAMQTRIFQATTSGQVAMEPGFRLVFELGFRAINVSTTSFTGSLAVGAPGVVADHSFAAGVSTDLCPWLEIDRDLVP